MQPAKKATIIGAALDLVLELFNHIQPIVADILQRRAPLIQDVLHVAVGFPCEGRSVRCHAGLVVTAVYTSFRKAWPLRMSACG